MDSTRLTAIPLFAALDPDQLEAVAAVASELVAEPGQALATQGDFGHALYAIEEGTADVSRGDEQVRTLGPGDVFGEVAVLAAGRRTATVTATSRTQLIALFKRDVWTLERECPEAGERLRQLVAERLAAPQTS